MQGLHCHTEGKLEEGWGRFICHEQITNMLQCFKKKCVESSFGECFIISLITKNFLAVLDVGLGVQQCDNHPFTWIISAEGKQ